MPQEAHDKKNKFEGLYRARVVEVDLEGHGEKNKYGEVKVFIPDVMSKEVNEDIDEFKDGIVAYPANSFGGYNSDDTDKTSFYARSVFVPLKNSYITVFFEGGDIQRCFYVSGWNGYPDESSKEDENPPPLPPENRGVEEPHKVYTLLKSSQGRSIIVCDSTDQCRVEITGKKRMLDDSEGPSGNAKSVYTIPENQTTILLDERESSEKLLIQTWQGDYINLDIKNRKLLIEMESDIVIKTKGKLSIETEQGIEIKSEQDIAIHSTSNVHLKADSNFNIGADSNINVRAGSNIALDGSKSFWQSGRAVMSRIASVLIPIGERDK